MLGHCYAPMFLVYLVIGALHMFFDDDDDDDDDANCSLYTESLTPFFYLAH